MEAEVAQTSQQFHHFEVDSHIVNDLIYRQNGTISTALRELVMNAFDANSKRVDILLWECGFEVMDTGDGFENESAILRNFKRFGAPHVDDSPIYGRFRIGRGQVMAFAKTKWHSKTFEMSTNIRDSGAGFVLKNDVEYYDGCKVSGQFYTPLQSYELNNAISELTCLVRYSPFPVFINQIQVNTQDGVKWDFEDDKVKIRFNPKGHVAINLYSLGILVKELQMYRYGVAADVVTKQALQLNMARNEINETDPLWQHVHAVLRAELRKRHTDRTRMSEAERNALIDQFCTEELSFTEIVKLPLLKDARGKSTSFDKELCRKRPWTLCEDDDARVGDLISTRGDAFVMTRSELNSWQVDSIEALLDFAKVNIGSMMGDQRNIARYYRAQLYEVEIRPFETIKRGVDSLYELIGTNDLLPIEKAQRNALQYVAGNMSKRLEKIKGEKVGKRKIHIGVSHAQAWTDSSTYIAFNRNLLSLFENGLPGITQLTLTMLHEFTHHDGSTSANGHDMAFYESFHDAAIVPAIKDEIVGNAISSLRNQYKTELENANIACPAWLNSRDDCVITMTLLGQKPTPLLLWTLDILGVPFKKRNGVLEMPISKTRLYDIGISFEKRINTKIRKNGIALRTTEELSHISDWMERNQHYYAERCIAIGNLLKQEGIEVNQSVAEVLNSFAKNRCSFGGLSSLTANDAFGVKCLHSNVWMSVRCMAGRSFNFSSNMGNGWEQHGMTASTFEDGGREGRFKHYKTIIEELLKGIKDPEERAEFVDRMFNDSTKKSLNQA